jgi:cell division septal protein FtsQ
VRAPTTQTQNPTPRRSANRKLPQRRALRLRAPDWAALGRGARAGLRQLAPLLAVLGVFGVAAGLGWRGWLWLTHSPRFAVRHIVVAGNARVTADAVRELAAIPPTTNLFTVATGAVARAVGQNPWIADVSVSRQLPDALRIEVAERQPAGVLVVEDAAYLVDTDGRAFKRAALEGGEADGLVVVTGMDRASYTRDLDAGAAAVREALLAATRWHERPERPPVGEVHLARSGLTLYTLERAVAVRVGRARGDDLAARLRRFDAIWSALSDEERAVCKTIFLDSATRADRVTVQLADARQ